MYASLGKLFTVFAVAAIAVTTGPVAQGQTLIGSHPDVVTPTYSFTNIVEVDNSTSPISTLFFGPPTSAGETFVFNPPQDFSSLSSDGEFEFEDGRLSVDISSNDDSTFTSISLLESGGAFNVVGSGTASAGLIGTVITPDGVFSDTAFFTQEGEGQGFWSLANSFSFPATSQATLVFDNQLTTTTEAGANIAFIDKKAIVVTIDENPGPPVVPEPGSLSLLALASCVGLCRRRR